MGAGDGFKIVPLGFDKNDVNSYISELNKKMAKMEQDMAANNNAMADARKLAEDADARIKAAVSEKDNKIAELNEKLLNERRGIDTYKVQIEDLQKQLRDKDDEMQQMSVADISTDKKKSKVYNDIINKANADAQKIIDEAKAQAEKTVMLAEGEKIRTQESIVGLLGTLTNEINKINTSCGEIFSAASFLDGVKAPKLAAVPDFTASAFEEPKAVQQPVINELDTFTADIPIETAENTETPQTDDSGLFEWDGSVDLRDGLGIAPDVDENEIIGSMSFGENENNGFNVIEQSAGGGMDALNPEDFAGVDMSDGINDAWSGFAEDKVQTPGLSDKESDDLGIEWTGMMPVEPSKPVESAIDVMSSIEDDLFTAPGDDEMTTEIAEGTGPDEILGSTPDMSAFGDFMSSSQPQEDEMSTEMGIEAAPAIEPVADDIQIEPLVSYLDSDSSKLYDESFNNELFAQTMPVNDISGLSGAVNDDLLEAAKAAESAVSAEQPAADDSPWLELQKELEAMEKLGAFNDSSTDNSDSMTTEAAAEPIDPFAVADSTTDLMWDMGTEKASDDDDDMSTTTSGFTF